MTVKTMDAIRLTSLFVSQCSDKIHWFLYNTHSFRDDGEPYPDTECNCGKTKWKDFEGLKHLEGEDVKIIEDGF